MALLHDVLFNADVSEATDNGQLDVFGPSCTAPTAAKVVCEITVCVGSKFCEVVV